MTKPKLNVDLFIQEMCAKHNLTKAELKEFIQVILSEMSKK